MRYVGYAALVATFWLLVATVRLIVHHDRSARPNAPIAVSAPPPAPKPVTPPPSVRQRPWECGEPLYDREGPSRRTPRRHTDDPCGADGHPLSNVAIVAGMNAVKPQIAVCYQRHQVPGTAMVNVVIGKRGNVSSAVVTGKFAGTPTGACVEAAVKTASFPPSDGRSTPYPFQLR